MGDYEGRTTVDAPVDDLFEYLSKVENLPRYMTRMTKAHAETGDEVSVEARIDPGDADGPRTVRGEAWFRIDADALTLAWGAEGPHDYSGELQVTPEGTGAAVAVRLHTLHDDPDIQDGITSTLKNIEQLSTELR